MPAAKKMPAQERLNTPSSPKALGDGVFGTDEVVAELGSRAWLKSL
jgi:hypothetical protein